MSRFIVDGFSIGTRVKATASHTNICAGEIGYVVEMRIDRDEELWLKIDYGTSGGEWTSQSYVKPYSFVSDLTQQLRGQSTDDTHWEKIPGSKSRLINKTGQILATVDTDDLEKFQAWLKQGT